MFKFGSISLASVYSLMLKIIGLIHKHVYRSKSSFPEEKSSNFSEKVVSHNSNVIFADEIESFNMQKNDFNLNTESSVFSLQSGVVSKNSKCQIFSGENVSGFLLETKAVEFVVQEMFSDQIIDSEIMGLEQNLEENRDEEETEMPRFHFNLMTASLSRNDEETRDNSPEMEKIDEKCFDEEEEEGGDSEENPELGLAYEDQMIKSSHFSDQESYADKDDHGTFIITQEKNDSENWMSTFLDQRYHTESSDDHENADFETKNNSCEQKDNDDDDDDDEFIELDPHVERESGNPSSCEDGNKSEDATQEQQKCRDSDAVEDEEEADVVSQHQHLVEQMKMELKNCRIRGLPTISEESETPKMTEDLRPLQIEHHIGYKEVMEGIQSFYKSYAEKMRKLDILNYQTSHAISFLHLKSEVFTAGKKRGNSLLPNILAGKVRRVYADPILHKSINEMQRDLEVVYVGQVCLSWEILWWLDARTRELLDYEGEGRGGNSYNRAAEEFQQFQVLVQRFMEDELFRGRRHDNFVKSRCLVRSLLQVPTIREDCVKDKREETDKIRLEMLVEIISETMLIFQEFVSTDKKAMGSTLSTKVDFRESGSSEMLSDVISILEKVCLLHQLMYDRCCVVCYVCNGKSRFLQMGRRVKGQMRSQNCIVKKHAGRILDREMLAAQVDLRLIWRVLSMSRLSGDQLVWCKNKLNNINFVGRRNRKVKREDCFLLFPC